MIILKKKLVGVSQTALARFLASAQRAASLHGEVNVLVTGSPEIRRLNSRYRHRDKATDVLSFPAVGEAGRDFAGDIAISAEVANRNARQFGHSLLQEMEVLLLHGVLHLAGYDHERDNGRMARMEGRLRSKLGLPDALIARNGKAHVRRAQARPSRRRKGSPS